MQADKSTLVSNSQKSPIGKLVFAMYIVFFMAMGLLLLRYEKVEGHLVVNAFHHPYLDVFFKNITHLGDGGMFAVLALYFLVRRQYRFFWYISLSSLFTALVIFTLKHKVFYFEPRPGRLFMHSDALHMVEGVNQAVWYSFPSGHTCAAFALATILVWITRNKPLQLLYLSIAILVGFSRVYISQHFIIDITVGALCGVFIAFFSVITINAIYHKCEKEY